MYIPVGVNESYKVCSFQLTKSQDCVRKITFTQLTASQSVGACLYIRYCGCAWSTSLTPTEPARPFRLHCSPAPQTRTRHLGHSRRHVPSQKAYASRVFSAVLPPPCRTISDQSQTWAGGCHTCMWRGLLNSITSHWGLQCGRRLCI